MRVPKRRRHANRAKMLVKSGMVPAGTPQARYAGSRSGPFRGTRYAVHREMRGARSASVVVSAVRGTRYTALPVGTLVDVSLRPGLGPGPLYPGPRFPAVLDRAPHGTRYAGHREKRGTRYAGHRERRGPRYAGHRDERGTRSVPQIWRIHAQKLGIHAQKI